MYPLDEPPWVKLYRDALEYLKVREKIKEDMELQKMKAQMEYQKQMAQLQAQQYIKRTPKPDPERYDR